MEFAIRFIVDRLHVATSYLDVAAEVNRRFKRAAKRGDRYSGRDRQRAVRCALRVHRENRRLYVNVMRGMV